MRQSMTGTELRIWIRIRGRQLGGWKFRRQHPIGPYFVDFYCPAARLIVEVDGPSHDDWAAAYDARRQAWLECEGYQVLRIPVSVIDEDAESAVEWIASVLEEIDPLPLRRLRRHLPVNGEDRCPSARCAATSP
jgi:very-short-patch-repair endonuclease